MTEDKGQSVSVFCHLTSVICFLKPDTIGIVLFKTSNCTKIYHTTFVTSLWDMALDGYSGFKQLGQLGDTFSKIGCFVDILL